MKPINQVVKKYGISEDDLEFYGKHKAKLSYDFLDETIFDTTNKYTRFNTNKGKLILVTATNPTPAGEGKTTISIALTDGINRLGYKAAAALRQPSMGPCFGMKGGATGGGKATLEPSVDLNLHFTGDFHAITSANNLISAIIDNHIHQGNQLNINPKKVLWKRCIDLNDRTLRSVMIGLGGNENGVIRNDEFVITVASEIMAIFCLAKDLQDLSRRLNQIIVAYDYSNKAIKLKDLNITDALIAILLDAFKPNVIQTSEGNLAIIHGGPFANIAHGCSSVIATKTAMAISQYTVTEAGFGADLGGEKFFDIKCRANNFKPDAVVLVTTLRSIKFNGNTPKDELEKPNLSSIRKGLANLCKHIENLKSFGAPICVAINRFHSDIQSELDYILSFCESRAIEVQICDGFASGSQGTVELAQKVVDLANNSQYELEYPYSLDDDIETKITKIATKIYGAKNIELSQKAKSQIKNIQELSASSEAFSNVLRLPICIAKTPYSFSDNPKLLGAPNGFILHISNIRLSAGAEMIVVETGNIMTMPGLPKEPIATKIQVTAQNKIVAPW